VALSGLGGDEIFAGYPSFYDIPAWTRQLRLPASIPGLGWAARAVSTKLGLGANKPKALSLLEYGGTYPGAYLLRRGLFLPHEIFGLFDDPSFVDDGLRRLAPLSRLQEMLDPDPKAPLARVATLESAQYMRNQLLRDADWAGMAHSLEIRTPLVDTEFARAVYPSCAVLTADEGKRALARAPKSALPSAITQRAKTGFSVPTHTWMADHLELNPPYANRQGQISRAWGRAVFQAFENGRQNLFRKLELVE
jgi:asparagine synthase (glutamine-hydrolysing)